MNDRHRLFAEAYCGAARFNATEAARQAGYAETSDLAREGNRLLSRQDIRDAIDEILSVRSLGQGEVLQRLTEIVNLDASLVGRCMRVVEGREVLDWDMVEELGLGHHIKKITPTKWGHSIEWHDKVKALELIGKHRRMFTDRHEVSLAAAVDLERLDETQLRLVASGKADPATLALAVVDDRKAPESPEASEDEDAHEAV